MSSAYFGQSDQMEPRRLGRELSNIAKTSEPIIGMMDAQAQREGENQMGLSRDFSDLALELYPRLAGAERSATTAQRRGDLKDLGALGSQYRARLGEISPEWSRAVGALDTAVARAGDTSPLLDSLTTKAMSRGPSAIRSTLEQQALSELALGGELSPEEIRNAAQSARAAYSSRGLAYSAPAITGEILNRDSIMAQKLAGRRQFASGVQALALGEDEANQRFALGTEAQRAAETDAARSFIGGAVGTQQNALAPVLGMFGRTSVAPTSGAAVASSAPNIIGAGSSSLGPLLSYGSDAYNTTYNSQAATRISNANNMSAIHGAVIGAVGSMAGAGMKMCWVAREIFGSETVNIAAYPEFKWRVFREWLLNRGPWWLRVLYQHFGERFAAWLKGQPRVKALLRPWFEARVQDEIDRLDVLRPLQLGAISLSLQPSTPLP